MLKKVQKHSQLTGYFILALSLFLVINTLGHHAPRVQWDLSDDQLYTLSDGSVELVQSLEQSVELNLFVSKALVREYPQFGDYASRVEDLILRLVDASGGGLRLKTVDPRAFSEEEDLALEAGLQGVPLNDRGDIGYFGLFGRVNGVVQTQTNIPFFQIERDHFLEYDIAKAIYGMARQNKPRLAVVSAADMFGNPQAMMMGQTSTPWVIIDQLREFYEVEQIFDPEGLQSFNPDILMMVHAAGLGPEMLYAIDQYFMRGGKAVIFADPWFESSPAPGMPGAGFPTPRQSTLNDLMAHWGVSIPDDTVVADPSVGQTVNIGENGQVVTAPYPVWMKTRPDHLNAEDVIAVDIQSLLLPSFGHIEIVEKEGVEISPLLMSTQNADLITTDGLERPDVRAILQSLEPKGEQYIMAARISGLVETSFPNGPPSITAETDVENGESEAKTAEETGGGASLPVTSHLVQSDKPLNVILVADADMLVDRFWVQSQNFFGQTLHVPISENGIFALNAIENLSGSSSLISLRSRGTGNRPFTRMDDIAIAAEEKWRAREQELTTQLIATEEAISALQSRGQEGSNLDVGDASEEVMETYRNDLIALRKELRAVNHALRQDIDALESKIRHFNILLMPMFVVFAAMTVSWIRRRKRLGEKLAQASH